MKTVNGYWLEEGVCFASLSGAKDIVIHKDGLDKEFLRIRVSGVGALEEFYLKSVNDDNIVIRCFDSSGYKFYIVCNLVNKIVDRYYSRARIMEMVTPITEGWKSGNVQVRELN